MSYSQPNNFTSKMVNTGEGFCFKTVMFNVQYGGGPCKGMAALGYPKALNIGHKQTTG